MNKLPAFQFYPGDWRKDPGVQALSYHDRGIWFEILCLMHESEQRGKLLLNGKPMPEEALARLLGLDKQILTKTLTTLLEYGVCSMDSSGTLINRRMVKDEELRKMRQESGKMGGNPILKKSKDIKELTNKDINELTNMDNHIDNQMVNQNPTKIKNDVNQNPTPSSSSSSSSSLKERKRKYKRKRNDTLSSKKLFGNILLTDEEYQKLKAKYNSHLDDVLNFINLKIESKGIAEWRKQYKSDYATILVWDRKGYLPQNIKKEGIFDD